MSKFLSGIAGLFLVATVACGGATSSGSGGANKSPYLIGVDNDLSGPYAYNRPFVSAFQTYAKYVNAKGGINGHPLKLDVTDDTGVADTGVANIKMLLAQMPLAIMGAGPGVVAIPEQTLIDAAKVPNVSGLPAGIPQLFTSPYYFDIGFPGTTALAMEANWIKADATAKNLPSPRVSIFSIDSPSMNLARQQGQTLGQSLGFNVVGNQSYAPTAVDFTAAFLKIRDEKPDYIMGQMTDQVAPQILGLLVRYGITAPFITFANVDASLKAAGAANFYTIRSTVVTPAVPAQNADVKTMEDAATKYGTLADLKDNSYFTYGWIDGLVLTAALQKCGDSCTPAAVTKALNSITNLSTGALSGPITFSSSQRVGLTSGAVYKWNATTNQAEQIGGTISAA
jgi:branched-chain amino acid transport system substrate-binding protein